MNTRKKLEGVLPEPVDNEKAAQALAKLTEYQVKTNTYWDFVRREFEQFNAEVRARLQAADRKLEADQ